jgi:hypothetical protein
MSRRRIGPEVRRGTVKKDLAEKLAQELKSGREGGQPFIYEQEYRTGKTRVTVIWDEWDGLPLQDHSATILRAYELAEGSGYLDRIALTSGFTVPEAHAAGLLPYEIIAGIRKGDPLSLEKARQALLEEGGTLLEDTGVARLRLATEDEMEACRQRLIRRFPGSDEVWIINREIIAHDYAKAQDLAAVEEE